METSLAAFLGAMSGLSFFRVGHRVRKYKMAVDLKKRGVTVSTGTFSNGLHWTTPYGNHPTPHYAFRLVFAALDNCGVQKTITVEKWNVSKKTFEELNQIQNGGVRTGISVTHLTEDLRVFRLTENFDQYSQYSSAFAYLISEPFQLMRLLAISLIWIVICAVTGWWKVLQIGIYFGAMAVATIAVFMYYLNGKDNVFPPNLRAVVSDTMYGMIPANGGTQVAAMQPVIMVMVPMNGMQQPVAAKPPAYGMAPASGVQGTWAPPPTYGAPQ